MRPKELPEWIVTVPLNPTNRRPLTKWPKDKVEEHSAWLLATQRNSNPAVGIVTGVSGLLVLDLDRKKGKDGLKEILQYLMALGYTEADAAREISTNPIITLTKSGGYHLYFKDPKDFPYKTTTRNEEAGIDIRGVGGMVVAPPTEGYRFQRMEWAALQDAPPWLLSYIRDNQTSSSGKGGCGRSVGVPVANGNGSSNSLSRDTQLITKSGATGTASQLLQYLPEVPRIEVHCPAHNDNNASAVIFRPEGRKRIKLFCSACGRSWSLGRLQGKNQEVPNGD